MPLTKDYTSSTLLRVGIESWRWWANTQRIKDQRVTLDTLPNEVIIKILEFAHDRDGRVPFLPFGSAAANLTGSTWPHRPPIHLSLVSHRWHSLVYQVIARNLTVKTFHRLHQLYVTLSSDSQTDSLLRENTRSLYLKSEALYRYGSPIPEAEAAKFMANVILHMLGKKLDAVNLCAEGFIVSPLGSKSLAKPIGLLLPRIFGRVKSATLVAQSNAHTDCAWLVGVLLTAPSLNSLQCQCLGDSTCLKPGVEHFLRQTRSSNLSWLSLKDCEMDWVAMRTLFAPWAPTNASSKLRLPFMLGIMEDFATLCIFLTTCTRLKHLEIANTSMKRLDWVSAAAILSFAKCGNHLDAIIPTLTTLRLSLLPTHGTSFASLYDKLLPRLTELQDLKMEGYITTCGTLRGCLPTLLRSLTLQHCSHLSLRDFCDYLTCAEATPQLQSFIVRDAVLNSHFGDTWQLQQLAWGRGVQVSLGDNKQGW